MVDCTCAKQIITYLYRLLLNIHFTKYVKIEKKLENPKILHIEDYKVMFMSVHCYLLMLVVFCPVSAGASPATSLVKLL